MSAVEKRILERVARSINHPDSGLSAVARGSILKQAARSYGARPILDEATVPSGFDPQAAVLFESVVEAAYLVEACDNVVQIAQIGALLAEFRELLAEDGLDKRVAMVARSVRRRDHQIEVLRIAALMAHLSAGVSETERRVLEQLAQHFDLPGDAVDRAISDADRALGSIG
jgi:hypothetical protein